jgi:hypothetical protein
VRADVGDTIKVVVHGRGDRASVPKPLDHKGAVCRISWHRVSATRSIAKFRALQARKVTFGSETVPRCPPPPRHGPARHSCHPVPRIGYAKIDS